MGYSCMTWPPTQYCKLCASSRCASASWGSIPIGRFGSGFSAWSAKPTISLEALATSCERRWSISTWWHRKTTTVGGWNASTLRTNQLLNGGLDTKNFALPAIFERGNLGRTPSRRKGWRSMSRWSWRSRSCGQLQDNKWLGFSWFASSSSAESKA
jgi:hypothetical protein